MQRSTIVLGAVLALLLAMGVLFIVGGTLSAELSVATARAADHPDVFERVLNVLYSDAVPQRLSDAMQTDPAACRLEDVTITLNNGGLLDAEWVSVSVDGAPGDIAVYSLSGEGDNIPALGAGSINLKLISAAEQSGPRTYHIQYYIYGVKREITITQNGEGQ